MSRLPAGRNNTCQVSRRPSRQRGISLLETLLAVVIGLSVLAAVLKFMGLLTESNTTVLKVTRLEQDLRTVMDIMLQDIRRANQYPQAVADLGQATRYLEHQPAAPQIDGKPWASGQSGSQISYAYQEADGKLISGRFSHDAKAGTVLMHTGSASAPETITDPAVIQIRTLHFQTMLSTVTSGSLTLMLPSVEVTLVGHLKGAPDMERTLVDRITWRNPWVSP